MNKYWVSKDSIGYCILEDVYDPIEGNSYGMVLGGIETEDKAIELCVLLNKVYDKGFRVGVNTSLQIQN